VRNPNIIENKMSSNQEQQQENQTPATMAAIPLLVPQKKKQTGKPKMRVRPARVMKKNTIKRKGPPVPPKTGATTVNTSATNSNTTINPSKTAANTTAETEGNNAPAMAATTLSKAESDTTSNVAAATLQKRPQAPKKILPRKPNRQIKPVRPTKISTIAKKGLSINVGSAMNKVRQTSIDVGENRQSSEEAVEQVQQHEQGSFNNTDSNALAKAEDDIDMSAPTGTSNATTNAVTAPSKSIEEVEIIPYQHMGQLDPALNIAPPKPNEKTMKDFCTKYKAPRAANEENNNNNNNNTNDANNNSNEAQGDGAVAIGTASNEAPGEEVKDNRSGPLVEIINGEIVIKESSMIVGGRRTMEEVDRELDGAIVVEENTGITATYTSFTKRQKVQRWDVAETRKFYLALRQCGTDFSTMESFFDGADEGNTRQRKQLKSKYMRECRKNLHLIDMAMNPKVQLPLDLSVFGDLDMDAVKDTVVPLGQASVPGGITSSANTNDITVVTPAQSMTPVDFNDGEPEVVVEIMGEENDSSEPVMVTQDLSQFSKGGAATGSDDQKASKQSSDGAAKTASIEVNSIPLLALAATKKKPRPKFRMKPKGPTKGNKGKAKSKRPAK